VIPSPVLDKLEYGEILRRLSTHCRFSVAARGALEIRPSSDRRIVRNLLDLTAEAVELLFQQPEFSVGGARDINDQLGKAEKGGRLQPHDLMLVMDTLRAGRELRRLFQRIPEARAQFPNLLEFAEAIENFAPLEAELERSIGPRGDVLDTASADLGRLRATVRVAHSRLMDRLNSFVTGNRFGSALRENIITIRDGRYVVPVRSESRGLIKGIVHDTSSSGQTLFVEPFDVVELNNRWREQQIAEQREIERILDVLSQKIGADAEPVRRMVDAIASVDLAVAKARLAEAMRATRPRLFEPPAGAGRGAGESGHPTHRIRLHEARHPLLDPSSVVPISVEMGTEFRILLITGPNTGGKTVALKTVGLLTLMAQAGMFIPAADTSVLSVFPSVYVDIGDEQSIEQSLSTFSSHIRNIIQMLRDVGSDSLVLLDEVGAGTDPQEGSALARALMSSLLRKKAMVLGTTHYSEVKAYAYATPGVENASVEFDIASLAPTYRLIVGVPGRSNALAIARRLGMPEEIVGEATTLLDPGDGQTEQLIEDIRTRRDEISVQLEATRQARDEARLLRRRAAQSIREAEAIRADARADAIAEVERELASAREAVRELERSRSMVTIAKPQLERHVESIKTAERQVKATQRQRVRSRPVADETPRRTIRAGDSVRLLALDQQGEVLAVDGDEAEVQLGSLKLRQPLDQLERLGRARQTVESAPRITQTSTSEAVPIEIDVRGHRVEEIGSIIELYLQDAYLIGLPWVRIIHGKGTGALRQAVRELLRDNPVVAKAEQAGDKEGGDGATVARLSQR